MDLLQVVRITITIRHHRHLEIVVFLFKLILSLVDGLEFLSESDLHGVLLNECYEFLLAQLEVLLYQVLHREEGLAQGFQVLHGV